MNRKEKFKQANREANATWLALLIVIVFGASQALVLLTLR